MAHLDCLLLPRQPLQLGDKAPRQLAVQAARRRRRHGCRAQQQLQEVGMGRLLIQMSMLQARRLMSQLALLFPSLLLLLLLAHVTSFGLLLC